MFSALKGMVSTGASPVAAKAMIYIIGILLILFLSIGGTLTWKLYQKQGEITLLTEQNVQLRSNVLTLKGNVQTLTTSLENKDKAMKEMEERYKKLVTEIEKLLEDRKIIQGKANDYREKLRKLKEELESEESNYLNSKVPPAVVDTLLERMFGNKEPTGDSRSRTSSDN